MRPVFTGNNEMNGLPFKFKHFCKILFAMATGIKVAYFKNLAISEFCLGMIHSLEIWNRAMFAFIAMVSRPRVPPQIIQGNMGADAIFMATFMPRGAWTSKRKKNKQVDTDTMVAAQRDPGVTFAQRLAQYCPSWRLYPAQIANFVTKKPGNLFPIFFGDGNLRISHGGSLLFRESLGLGPMGRTNAA